MVIGDGHEFSGKFIRLIGSLESSKISVVIRYVKITLLKERKVILWNIPCPYFKGCLNESRYVQNYDNTVFCCEKLVSISNR